MVTEYGCNPDSNHPSAIQTRSHFKNTIQARLCELRERENAGRKRAQVYPLRYSEHVFSRRRRDLVAQRAAAQGIFEIASSYFLGAPFFLGLFAGVLFFGPGVGLGVVVAIAAGGVVVGLA